MAEKSIIVIGAGVAGLCAGVYARQNGFNCTILEMHTQPGGLCTSWRRRGYIVDGCIHWLVGSSPANGLHRLWQEVGLVQGRRFIDLEIFQVLEDRQGRSFTFYTDPEKLEREMLALAPQDAAAIREFVDGLRFALKFNPPMGDKTGLAAALETGGFLLYLLPRMRTFRKWLGTTSAALEKRFSDPLLRRAIREMWLDDFSIFFVLSTLAWLQRKEAGYPIGGSLPMMHAVEERFLSLGGQVRYGAQVEKILVEGGRAAGVRLADGNELKADIVISAADGHATIFDMLDGKYVDDSIRAMYDTWKLFPGIIFIGLGVNRTFELEPQSVVGTSFELAKPIMVAGREVKSLCPNIFNFDPTLAPAGKTVMRMEIESSYAYWKQLHENPAAYEAEKKAIGEAVVRGLEQRWPGISSQVEMIDIATPVTFERYTGNWKGSFEGWLMTPSNGMARVKKTLPGLANFYMAGQWVSPGGGLPSGVMTAREVVQMICKAEGRKFTTRID